MQKLISFDLQADFGFFRKPETNEGIALTYTHLHKPALLGILGAIIGLGGYRKKGEVPEYAQKLAEVKVGVQPLNTDQGNFPKTVVKYTNTVGYANKGSNFLAEEAMLVKPAYRVFLLLDDDDEHHAKLIDYLKTGQAEFLPYFGKNEHAAWWSADSFREYADFEVVDERLENFKIGSLFEKGQRSVKPQPIQVRDRRNKNRFDPNAFAFFERLPSGFDPELHQYELGNFALTTFALPDNDEIDRLYALDAEHTSYVQVH